MKTCPPWPSLLDHRFDPSLPEPAGWDEALEHLDSCPECLEEAESIDPTLMFRHLPAPVLDDQEVADMKRAVHTLRTSSALQQPSAGERLRVGVRRLAGGLDPRHTAAWRVAAAALLAAGITAGVAIPPESAPSGDALPAIGGTAEILTRTDDLPLWAYGGAEEADLGTGQDGPVVEGVVSPEARVYSFPASPDEQVAVVMVIDPTLDV